MPGPSQRAVRLRARKPVACKQRPLTLSKLGMRDRTRAVLKAFELMVRNPRRAGRRCALARRLADALVHRGAVVYK
ncbi:hypothetical protein [Xanthomonas campestris]|uniref:hypothetical protein n=1 Tax=Xanthomonas campestris TaxID=339 RepID=UPI001E3D6EF1|nr:hypothetical protein [Xanthomonas campestris]WVL59753.1 hypothetical protein LLE68_015825 [Xanthomonas campestris pv. barbareae]